MTRGFKFASLNITSQTRHIDKFLALLENKSLDLIAINETRLDHPISDAQVNIIGYDIVRKDGNRTGDGVAIYIKSSINYTIR